MPATAIERWRSPLFIVLCGCIIAAISFGPRSSLGLFLSPMSSANAWSRDVFSLAIAIQNLLWGVGQPFAGALADRFGAARVLSGGALLYGLGLYLMTSAQTAGQLDLSAGVLIGFGLSGCSFNIVLGGFNVLVPERWRLMSVGAATAAGSFGQFLFAPLGAALIDNIGWQHTLLVFAGMMLLVLPLSLAFAMPQRAPAASAQNVPKQSIRQAMGEAFAHRSYVLLVLGYFTCGFQLAFITVHLPAYLLDRGLSVQVGGWTLAVIGMFNIIGSLSSGWLATRMPKRYLLAIIYFLRALAIAVFVSVPASPAASLIFGASMGLLWLSTIPPTSALVSVMFGTQWAAMLYGFTFFSHQVGGFLGVWLGGILYEAAGSYSVVWWLSVALGVASALINLPIVERPVERPQLQPA